MLRVIYVLKEFKEHATGFWIYKFSCKLHTVWEFESHVVLDHRILCLVDMPAHQYCRCNWSSCSLRRIISEQCHSSAILSVYRVVVTYCACIIAVCSSTVLNNWHHCQYLKGSEVNFSLKNMTFLKKFKLFYEQSFKVYFTLNLKFQQ
jgi:hypothetical protein